MKEKTAEQTPEQITKRTTMEATANNRWAKPKAQRRPARHFRAALLELQRTQTACPAFARNICHILCCRIKKQFGQVPCVCARGTCTGSRLRRWALPALCWATMASCGILEGRPWPIANLSAVTDSWR